MPPAHPAPLEGGLREEESMPWRSLPQLQANFKVSLNQTKLGPDCSGRGVSGGLFTNVLLSQSPLCLWEGQLAVVQWWAFGSMGPCFCSSLDNIPQELWK